MTFVGRYREKNWNKPQDIVDRHQLCLTIIFTNSYTHMHVAYDDNDDHGLV